MGKVEVSQRAEWRANTRRDSDLRRERLRRWRAQNRAYNLASLYAITVEQYAALLAYQSGACVGCGTTERAAGKALVVDHDHDCCPYPAEAGYALRACGKCVRGLLCGPCNLGDALAGAPHVDWPAVMAGGAAPAVAPTQPMTLRDAVDQGVVVGRYEAVKKRLQRDSNRPTAVGKRGQADLYDRQALTEWAKRENGRNEVPS